MTSNYPKNLRATKFITVDKEILEVRLPSDLNSSTIEFVLRQGYRKSKNANIAKCHFNFSKVLYYDNLAISITAIWIKELRELKNKEVSITVPLSSTLLDQLKVLGFVEYISGGSGINKEPADLSCKRYSTIGFFKDELDFVKYLEYLKGENFEIDFKDLISTGLVDTKKLRDIIISELGDNIFKHSNAKFSNILISKFSARKREEWNKALLKGSSPLTYQFFSDLSGGDFLSIVLSDNGEGISKTLDKSYKAYNNLPFKSKVNGEKVLLYSLDKYSSKNYDSIFRLDKGFEELVLAESKIDYQQFYRPVTGLHKINELVKSLNGLIYIRCGKSILSRYFPKNGSLVDRTTNSEKVRQFFSSDICHLNGTVIQLLIPMSQETIGKVPFKIPEFAFPELSRSDNRVIVSLVDYLQIFFSGSENEKISRLKEFFRTVNKLRKDKKIKGIILDCHNGENGIATYNKYFLVIISILITSQKKDFTNILINVPQSLNDILRSSFNNKEGYDYPPLVYFDNSFDINFLSVSDVEESKLRSLTLQEKLDQSVGQDNLIKKFHTLFINQGSIDRPEILFAHNRNNIFQRYSIFAKDWLSRFIDNSSNEIFFKDVKVRLKSNVFCEGFYQIENLVNNSVSNQVLISWLKFILLLEKPDAVFSLSKHGNDLMDMVLNTTTFKDIWHTKIPNPLSLDYISLIQSVGELATGDSLVIVTDVIGTAKSIINVLRSIPPGIEVHLYCIVNASNRYPRKIVVNDRNVEINSIVQKEWIFYEVKPYNWQYHEIWFVDDDTNRLKKSNLSENDPLWFTTESESEILTEFKLSDLIRKERIIHNDNICSSYHFNIDNLVSQYGYHISDIISNNIHEYHEADNTLASNDVHILSIYEKLIMSDLVKDLCGKVHYQAFPNTISLRVFYSGYIQPNIDLKDKTIILIEDIYCNAELAYRFLDYCSKNEAKTVFIYYLINKGHYESIDRLKGVKNYKNLQVFVEYLIDTRLPIYSLFDNPFEDEKSDLEDLIDWLPKTEETLYLRAHISSKIAELTFSPSIEDGIPNIYKTQSTEKLNDAIYLSLCTYDLRLFSDLILTLNDVSNNLEKCISLLDIIGEEFYWPILSSDETKPLRDDFEKSILYASEYILSNEWASIGGAKNNIVKLIRFFDANKLVSLLLDLSIKKQEFDRDMIIQICLTFFETDLDNLVVKNQFISLLRNLKIPDDLKDEIKFVQKIIHDEIQFEQNISNTIDFVDSLNSVRQQFHSINQSKDQLTDALNYNFVDLVLELGDEAVDKLNTLSIAISKLESKNLRFENVKNKLSESRLNIQNIAHNIKEGLNLADPNVFTSRFSSILKEIETSITSNPLNFRNLTELLIQEVEPVIENRMRVYHGHSFQEKQISLLSPSERSEIGLYVFAEKRGLIEILDNILTNLYEHSESTTIKYFLEYDEKFVELNIYDDGIPYSKWEKDLDIKMEKGRGIIEDLTKLYDGSFEYLEYNKSVEGQFNNHSILKLRRVIE